MMTDLQTHFSFFDFLDYHNRKINKLDTSGNLKDKLMSIIVLTDSDETDNEIH